MKEAKDIINDPIKSTLFGKFYEKIIRKWLLTEGGFIVDDNKPGKPMVYWKDVKPVNNDSMPALRLNGILKKYQEEKQRCIPDGLLHKDGKNYIWEAKNWPMYSEGMEPLDQLRKTIFSMPLILTRKAKYKAKDKDIHGILFSWWSKPEGSDDLENEVKSLIAPQHFEIFYTSDILEDCIKKKYSWYLEIVETEEKRMEELFKDLHGES